MHVQLGGRRKIRSSGMNSLRKMLRVAVTLCVLQVFTVQETVGRQSRQSTRYRHPTIQQISAIDLRDKIVELQCYAKCEVSSRRQNCYEQCKIDLVRQPRRGYCPNVPHAIFKSISPVQKISCLDSCNYDYACPEIQKCCNSSCGSVCMEPLGIREDPLLPPIPKILKFKLPRGHKVEVTIQSAENATFVCHVESRFHIGSNPSPRKFGMWQWQPVEKIAELSDTRSKRTDISFDIKPGRWYQVRVAAINAYGFRGYSEPSPAFTLPNHPKPPKPPLDLKVIAAHYHDGYYNIRVVWCPSKSNLPIEKYKVIWSLYVQSKDESLLSNEAYVKDTNQFEITKLLPESSYYIQVQAMAISGSRRLKSEKFSILYNTTATRTYLPLRCSPQIERLQLTENNNNNNNHKAHEYKSSDKQMLTSEVRAAALGKDSNSTTSYDVRFRLNRKFGMIVQISGFHPHKEKVYELCPKETNCEQREYSAIRAKKDSLEFSKLKFNTTYMLKAFKANMDAMEGAGGIFMFTTPKCENFRKRFPKMQIEC